MLALTLVLSGCGKSDSVSHVTEGDAVSGDADTSEQSAFDENGVSAEGEFPIVKDKIELTVMIPNQTNIEDIETNEFTKWYEEKTNIKINWNVVPSESLTDKVNISLSSGDLPDVYMTCGISQTQQQVYGVQGAFVGMNDYIDKYGSVLANIESQVDGLKDIITMGDGNIYCLPYVEKCLHCENSSKMWVNKRWLEKLNINPPTTVEEFEAMLRAFKDQDPNGNGLADEIPLLTFDGGWHSDELSGWLTNPFVYTAPDNNYVYLNNGEIQLSYMQDGWKDALKWMNTLYKDGLYYDQSLIINLDQARQVAASGGDAAVVGCFLGGTPNTVPGDEVDQWKDYVALSPIEGEAGRYATWMPYSQINPTAYIITSACKNPAAAFRWAVEQYHLDICFKKCFGEEGTSWKKITPGEDGIPADAVDLNSGKPSEVSVNIDGIAWGDEQNFCWRGIGLRVDTPDVPELRYNQYQIGDYETNMEYRINYDTRDYMLDYNPNISICLPPLVYDEAQATELANTESIILTYIKEMAARYITGDADVDADWDDYLNELDIKGVSQLKEIYQDAYDAKYK